MRDRSTPLMGLLWRTAFSRFLLPLGQIGQKIGCQEQVETLADEASAPLVLQIDGGPQIKAIMLLDGCPVAEIEKLHPYAAHSTRGLEDAISP